MTILIADDSRMSRVLLRGALKRWGYNVVEAEDGAQAYEILAQPDAPRLAVLDWVMPNMTGPEVCRRIRETHREPYTYILLLTSKSTKDEIVEGLEAGADDYITKPFDEHELQVRLRAGKRIVDLQEYLLKAQEELKERANKDLLTMLPNRSAIATGLSHEIARCHRDHRSVGIILLDIDRFKSINDTYGHFAGDAVLREVASRLKHNVRPYDVVGRYGGEEFLVVLPNCDLEQAAHQAERMRERLCAEQMILEGAELTVTASFGVTVSDGSERNPETFVRVADEALYQAKASGRNCVRAIAPKEYGLEDPAI